jgi:2-iminobutanoate/2-iminopropanoate deaminase
MREAGRARVLCVLVVAVGALALAGCVTVAEKRQVIATDGAPKAVGVFSQAIRVDDTLYVAGQLGIDRNTGALAPGGTVAETRQALDNIKAIVEAAGLTLADVVSVTVYLVDLADFAAMNQVYAGYFPSAPPARATVQVAGLVRGARIEISAIAAR